MPNTLSQYATTGEARTARKLVRAALADGWQISVNDGYETTLHRSTSERAVIDALCTTDMDAITIHLPISGKSGGKFLLIYGNADDGSELIADHSDNDNCNRLVDVVYPNA
jgi:hypothetical protein